MTHDSLMPWGEHKGRMLKDVPVEYLAWLSKQSWITSWPALNAYLKSRASELEGQHVNDSSVKEGFDSYEDYRHYRGF